MLMDADTHNRARSKLVNVFSSVLLGDMLTPAYDPRPYAVIGVKGSLITVKRGKEIKSRCKVIKYAGQEECDICDWNQERQPMNHHNARQENPRSPLILPNGECQEIPVLTTCFVMSENVLLIRRFPCVNARKICD